jgi:hypothetical protein
MTTRLAFQLCDSLWLQTDIWPGRLLHRSQCSRSWLIEHIVAILIVGLMAMPGGWFDVEVLTGLWLQPKELAALPAEVRFDMPTAMAWICCLQKYGTDASNFCLHDSVWS